MDVQQRPQPDSNRHLSLSQGDALSIELCGQSGGLGGQRAAIPIALQDPAFYVVIGAPSTLSGTVPLDAERFHLLA
jgi:hypothetical protein